MKKWQTKGEYKVGSMFEKRGCKVLYQYKVGPYKLDLFLPELHLNIEINGPHHLVKSRIINDKKRLMYLEQKGYKQYCINAIDTGCRGMVRDFVNKVLNENSKHSFKPVFNTNIAIQLQKWNDYQKIASI